MLITFLGADLFQEKKLGWVTGMFQVNVTGFDYFLSNFEIVQFEQTFLKYEFILNWGGNGGYHQVLPVLTLLSMLNRTLLLHLIISICTLLHVFVDFCSIYQCLILLFFSEWIFPRFFKFFCVCWILLVFFCWFSIVFYHNVFIIEWREFFCNEHCWDLTLQF